MFPHDSALRNLKSKDKQACLEKRPFLAFFGVKHSTSPRNALWHERLEVLFTLPFCGKPRVLGRLLPVAKLLIALGQSPQGKIPSAVDV